jgi:sulfonate transport system permease protein
MSLIHRQELREWPMIRAVNMRAWVGLVFPALLLVTWEISVATGLLNAIFFPPPSRLSANLLEMVDSGRLVAHTATTLATVVSGFFIGGVLGFFAGLLLGSSRRLRQVFEPTLAAIYAVPKVALLPIFLAIFGVGASAVVALVAASTFFYVWIYTMGAAMRVPESHLASARVFGANRRRIFFSVFLPASLPEALVGLRVGVTVALLVTLTAEYVLGTEGIGYLIFGARAIGRYSDSYLGILVAGVLGFFLQIVIVQIGRVITPWQLLDSAMEPVAKSGKRKK